MNLLQFRLFITMCSTIGIFSQMQQNKLLFAGNLIKIPWQVSIRVHAWHFCGGSIIGNEWIITSAYCIK